MAAINRRQFLQFSASTLATIGLSQVDFLRQAGQLDRVLAQGKPGRKLALLVGINNYPMGINPLQGCLTDVEMQYELLVHRYGFDPKDILVLSDVKFSSLNYTPQVGTRSNILEAFQKHLIDQAQSGDTVVFHYSGHGSRVIDPNPAQESLNGTLVPADVTLAGDQTNQIMGKTLFLLSSLLKTENFTMVLDSCYSGAGTRGNSVVRSLNLRVRDGGSSYRPNGEELEFQKALISRLQLSPQTLKTLRTQGIARGVALGSAQKDQEALDGRFDGFHAGAFTYLLTRYLWQLPKDEALKTTFASLELATKELSNRMHAPIYEVQPQKDFGNRPIYLTSPVRSQFADAVVRSLEANNQIRFWLGGVNSQSLKALTKDAVFDVIDEQGKSIATVTQSGRAGLEAIGTVTSGGALKPGMLMRERLRSIPTDLKLKVGIDPSLGKDVEAARTALAAISKVEPVMLGGRSTATEVHCILGRLTERSQQAAKRGNLQVQEPVNSWGLFNDKEVPIPGTFQKEDLPVDFVVKSLRSRLKVLLANQILSSTVNGDSSKLKVKTVIRPKDGKTGPELTQMTAGLGGESNARNLSLRAGFKANTVTQILVSNEEPQTSLHMAAFAIGDDGNITLLHPANWDSPESASLVPQGKTLPFEMEVYGPAGFFEVLVVASRAPLREMLRGMQTIARGRGLKRGDPLLFDQNTSRSAGESEDTIGNLMRDLVGDLSRAGGDRPGSGRALTDSQAVAVISIPVQVTD